jgi:branched-chain amino acid transport system permease protein
MKRLVLQTAAIIAILAGVALVGSSYVLYVLNATLLAILGALALNLLMGTAGVISLGNSAFLAVGAFTSVFCLRAGLVFPLDLVVAVAASAVVGLVIGLPALRLRGLELALATIAGYFIITYFANSYESGAAGAGTGFNLTPFFAGRDLAAAQQSIAWMLICVVAVALIVVGELSSHRLGRAWRLIRDQEMVAQTVGIPVVRYKLLAFAISSALIGMQGSLAAHISGSVDINQFTLAQSIACVAMVVIGGLDSIVGAVVGAAIVTVLPLAVPNLLRGVLSAGALTQDGPAISEIAYAAILIVCLISSPWRVSGLADRFFAFVRARRTGAQGTSQQTYGVINTEVVQR